MEISISQIDGLPGPVYVLVAGAISAGKSHVVRQFIKKHKIMDVDDVMEELGLTEYNQENYSRAMAIMSSQFDEEMEKKTSVVAMGTGADFKFTLNRLFWAKRAGYRTVLLHIAAPLVQCFKQNNLRRDQGKRAVDQKDLFRIVDTFNYSEENFHKLKETDLIDWYCQYDNSLEDSTQKQLGDFFDQVMAEDSIAGKIIRSYNPRN